MSFRDARQAVDGLAEEVGELAREVNHRFGLANSQRIDLDAAWAQMMEKVTARDAARWTRKAR